MFGTGKILVELFLLGLNTLKLIFWCKKNIAHSPNVRHSERRVFFVLVALVQEDLLLFWINSRPPPMSFGFLHRPREVLISTVTNTVKTLKAALEIFFGRVAASWQQRLKPLFRVLVYGTIYFVLESMIIVGVDGGDFQGFPRLHLSYVGRSDKDHHQEAASTILNMQ
jgi:hypothetical protein